MKSWNSNNDLADHDQDLDWQDEYQGRTPLSNVHKIDLDRIVADEQSRKHFDQESLQQLADNLQQHGQLQPCRVRWDSDRSVYRLIAGERRYRAAKLAELLTLDCIVVENADDKRALRENILENAQRQDLRPVEQAQAFQNLMESEGWSGAELARNIQVNRSTVTRALKLLTLPEEMQRKIDAGELPLAEALREAAAPTKSPTRKRRRISREEKIPTKKGTVCVKGRRLMTDDVLIDALTEALDFLRRRQQQESERAKAA